MRSVYFILYFVIFILLLGFALKNSQPVELHYYLGFVWRAPLIFTLAVAFVAGVIVAMIACIAPIIKQRKQIALLKNELKSLESKIHNH